MIPAPRRVTAALVSSLPSDLHWRGEPNDWVKTTRPGKRLHSFLEGPCFTPDGDLWLVDVPYGRIFRVDPHGAWTLAFSYDGEPHAIRPWTRGTFVIADYRHGLLILDPERAKIDVLCDRVNTERFRGLGDLAIAPNGDLWFTDPGRSSLSDASGRVFRLRRGAEKPDIVLANVPYPNGIAFSPDGSVVYLAVTRANAVWRFLADTPDPVWPMVGTFLQLSGGLGPDGLSVNQDGCLAIAQAQAGRVYLVDVLGDLQGIVTTPGGLWTTACAFSRDGRALTIVEAQNGSVYRADLTSVFDVIGTGTTP